MSLNDDVANFLLSTDVSVTYAMGKLEFTLGTFRVDYEGYREIGHKVRSGAINVQPVTRDADSRTAAVYTPLLDKLSVPADIDLSGRSGQSIRDQAMIVHECTHALMDYHLFQTSGTIQETAAYIAGGLYSRAKMRRPSGGNDPQASAIVDAAADIVNGRSMVTNPGQVLSLSDPDVAALMRAVNAHRDYNTAHHATRVDGISGGLINPWYLPRHG